MASLSTSFFTSSPKESRCILQGLPWYHTEAMPTCDEFFSGTGSRHGKKHPSIYHGILWDNMGQSQFCRPKWSSTWYVHMKILHINSIIHQLHCHVAGMQHCSNLFWVCRSQRNRWQKTWPGPCSNPRASCPLHEALLVMPPGATWRRQVIQYISGLWKNGSGVHFKSQV